MVANCNSDNDGSDEKCDGWRRKTKDKIKRKNFLVEKMCKVDKERKEKENSKRVHG